MFDNLLKYFEVKLNSAKLSLIERVAIIMGFCMFMMVCMFITLIILIQSGLGLGSLMAEWIGSEAGGYFLTAGIYLLLLVVAILFKKKLLRFFVNVFVGLLTDGQDEKEEE
ncbi:MAG: hypothetical protein R2800_14415 [Flavipsychrobacter sp.]